MTGAAVLGLVAAGVACAGSVITPAPRPRPSLAVAPATVVAPPVTAPAPVAVLEPHTEPPVPAAAAGPDPAPPLTGDARFEALAAAVADASSTKVLQWGPSRLGRGTTRVALLKRPGESGTPLFGYLYELPDGRCRLITVTAWGFSTYQGSDDPAALPTWGSVAHGDEEHTRARTTELTSLEITTRWIHGSYEHLEIELVHGSPVLRSDEWLERENNGHGFDETSGHKRFAPGAGPALARAKLHSMHVEVSAPSSDAATLAASLVEDPGPP